MIAVAFAIAEKHGRWRLTAPEIAQELGIAEQTLYHKLGRGELSFIYRDGRRLFADARDIAAYLDNQRPNVEGEK